MNAVILQLPAKAQRAAKRRLNRVDVDARHSWMMENRDKWENEETEGAKYETNINVIRLTAELRKMWPDEYGPLTMARMRRDIIEGRKRIEKRNRVKAWLQSLGADLDAITTPEQALFFTFECMHARELPTSA
jgi:hypothetical protein